MQTIQTVRNIRRKYKPIARCRGDKKEQEQFRPTRTTADGFLRHSFLSLFEQGENLPDPEQTQKGFFDSLAILTRLYGFETIDVTNKSYPYNILLTHSDIQKQFRKSEQDIELKILRVDEGTVKLATNHTYNTSGNSLYSKSRTLAIINLSKKYCGQDHLCRSL